ncbi:MAG: PepSY-associated TM helix domain-containing protein [Chromatiales bacterium]
MRSDIIRLYKSVHTWTGIIGGLALFIAFYAGALTVFKEPIARWASPPSLQQVDSISLEDTPALISHAVRTNPEAAKSLHLYLTPSEHLPGRVSWEIQPEGADDHDTLSNQYRVASLQTDGTVLTEQAKPSRLADFIDTLHRVVGLPVDSEVNRWVMGVVAVLYSLALVSGVIVLLPTLVKDFFALRLGKNLKRMWLDAHNVVGIASLPLHLVMALTAVVFAYHDGIYSLQDVVIHDGKMREIFRAAQPPAAVDQPTNPDMLLPPAELVARAQAQSPGFEPHMLQYLAVTTPRAVVRVWGHDRTAIAPRAPGGFVPINPYTGEVLSTEFLPGKQSAASTTVSSFFALHFANYGGNTVRWAYFLLALAGAWLFFSGNLLWVESRRKKQRKTAPLPKQRTDVSIMANLTVGVSLGCIGGISLTIAAAKWLNGHVDDLTAWHQYVYYAVFFGSVAWAFVRGAARASIDLLRVAAAFTFFIPLTSLLAWVLPSMGMWAHQSPATLGVDLTALVAGGCFVWMASATSRRVYQGVPQDSVWSYKKA